MQTSPFAVFTLLAFGVLFLSPFWSLASPALCLSFVSCSTPYRWFTPILDLHRARRAEHGNPVPSAMFPLPHVRSLAEEMGLANSPAKAKASVTPRPAASAASSSTMSCPALPPALSAPVPLPAPRSPPLPPSPSSPPVALSPPAPAASASPAPAAPSPVAALPASPPPPPPPRFVPVSPSTPASRRTPRSAKHVPCRDLRQMFASTPEQAGGSGEAHERVARDNASSEAGDVGASVDVQDVNSNIVLPIADPSVLSYAEQTSVLHEATLESQRQADSSVPSPSSVQPPGLIKRIVRIQWLRLCPCGLTSYRHVHRWTKPIFCTKPTCANHAIHKDQSLYHCLNRQCSQRLCAQCFRDTPILQGDQLRQAQESWVKIPHDGFGQLPDFLTPESFASRSVPQLQPPPTGYWHIAGEPGGARPSEGTRPPSALTENGHCPLPEYCTRALSLLMKLPAVIPFPVFDYPPGGLGTRFTMVLTSTFWHMLLAVDKSESVSQFYTLLFQKITVLILFNQKHTTSDSGDVSDRTTVHERLTMAETGQWVPLIHELLCALQTVKPIRATAAETWKSKCHRAVDASLGGSWSLAFRALQTDTCPPRTPDTFNKVVATFITKPLPAHPSSQLKALCTKILGSSGRRNAAKLTFKHVDKRLRSIKSMAQPGSSKTKNVHLLNLAKSPWGHQLIHMWASLWISGKVPEHIVKLWSVGLVTPLGKKSGNGVRPITLFETAFKLATGLALDLHKSLIIKAVGAYQYGALLASGADRMIYNLRSLATASPDLLFVATDVKNAFGTVPRILALKALLKHAPALAPIMANIWLPGETSILAPFNDEQYKQFQAAEGVFQGECLSTAVFCIFLREVLDSFLLKCKEQGIPLPEKSITICAYVDDVVLVVPPDLLTQVWPIFVQTLADFNLVVETSKCKVWRPSGKDIPVEVTSLVEPVKDGLPVLGTAAGGQHATILNVNNSPEAAEALTVDTQKRLSRAVEDSKLLLTMMETPLAVATKQAGWLMLVRSLAVRLDFDMRILPPLVLNGIVNSFQQVLLSTAESILDLSNITTVMQQQMQLPGHLGGMYLTSPFLKLRVAHLASVAASWKCTYEWLQSRGVDVSTAFAAIDTFEARIAIANLRHFSIHVTSFGQVCTQYCDLPLLTFQQPLPIAIAALQGRLTAALATQAHVELWQSAEPNDQIRLLSSSGTGNGALYKQASKRRTLHLDDFEFQVASALRLGHDLPSSVLCQNCSAQGRMCSRPMSLNHFLSCKIGGGVSLIHRALATQLQFICRDFGATTKFEVPIPEFARTSNVASGNAPDDDCFDPLEKDHATGAIMDVVAYCPDGAEFLLDVSIRNPQTSRYFRHACSSSGYAADRGETDKRTRYPSAHGKHVTPCVAESFGRIGKSFLSFLDQAAVQFRISSPDSAAMPRMLKDQWFGDISASLAKAIARCYRTSAFGAQGRRQTFESVFPHADNTNDAQRLLLRQTPTVVSTHNLTPSVMDMVFPDQPLGGFPVRSAFHSRGVDIPSQANGNMASTLPSSNHVLPPFILPPPSFPTVSPILPLDESSVDALGVDEAFV